MKVDDLLAPVGMTALLRDNWDQKARHIPGTPRKLTSLATWQELNDVLVREFDPSAIRVTKSGKALPLSAYAMPAQGGRIRIASAQLVALLASGHTLVLNAAEQHLPEVRRTLQSLRATTGERCHANLYVAWRGADGFGIHFDAHDVLAVQLFGRKQWTISSPIGEKPVGRMTNQSDAIVPEQGAEYLDVTLSSGDVLYVPKGHWHRTATEHEPSVHVTFGVSCRTGASYLEWLASTLGNDAQWCENLPPAASVDADGGRRMRDAVACLTSHLRDLLENGTLADAFLQAQRVSMLSVLADRIDLPFQVCSSEALRRGVVLRASDLANVVLSLESREVLVRSMLRLAPEDVLTVENAVALLSAGTGELIIGEEATRPIDFDLELVAACVRAGLLVHA